MYWRICQEKTCYFQRKKLYCRITLKRFRSGIVSHTAIGIWLKRRTVWLLVSNAAVMRKNMCSLRRKKERPLSIYENNPKQNPRCSKRSVGGFCLSESGLTAMSARSVFSINKHSSARTDRPCRNKFVSFVSHYVSSLSQGSFPDCAASFFSCDFTRRSSFLMSSAAGKFSG